MRITFNNGMEVEIKEGAIDPPVPLVVQKGCGELAMALKLAPTPPPIDSPAIEMRRFVHQYHEWFVQKRDVALS